MRLFKYLLIISFITAGVFLSKPLFAKGNKNRLITKGYAAKIIPITSFQDLHLAGCLNVHLEQSEKPSLRIECPESEIDNILVKQNGQKLIVRTDKKKRFQFINQKIDVFVAVENLRSISAKGTLTLEGENRIHSDELSITTYGACKFALDINVSQLNIESRGSSSITLSGYSQNQDIQLEGASTYKASKLVSASANVNLHGSGAVHLDVERELFVKMFGSGNVFYKGNPSVQSQSYGTGKIKSI